MRRMWNRLNTTSIENRPDYAKWLIQLMFSEDYDNQLYRISAGNRDRLHESNGMPTTVFDSTSAIYNTSGYISNDSEDNTTNSIANSTLDLLNTGDKDLALMDYVLIVLYSITTVLAILGNSIAIIIFTKGKRSKTDLRPFLINLAAADLIMAIFCIPFTFTYSLIGNWIFSAPMCPIVMFLQTVSVTGSVSTNMAIGIDRFCAIAFPLNTTRNTACRYKCIIILIWIIAIAFAGVQLFVGGIQYNNITHHTECNEIWPNKDLELFYTILLLILTYMVPLIILTVTYSIVGYILCKRNLPGNADVQRDAIQLQSKLKIVKMLVTVVVLFALCWLPLHTFFFVLNFTDKQHHPSLTLAYFICHWIAMSNSFVNPIVYGLLNDSFRADLKYLVSTCVSPSYNSAAKSTRHGAIKIKPGSKNYHLSCASHSLETYPYTENFGHIQRNGSSRVCNSEPPSLGRLDTY